MSGKITERHARALLTIPSESQKKAYETIVRKDLNVRETEAYLDTISHPEKHRRRKTSGHSKNQQIAINTIKQSVKMIEKLGLKVKLEEKENDAEVTMIVHLPKE